MDFLRTFSAFFDKHSYPFDRRPSWESDSDYEIDEEKKRRKPQKPKKKKEKKAAAKEQAKLNQKIEKKIAEARSKWEEDRKKEEQEKEEEKRKKEEKTRREAKKEAEQANQYWMSSLDLDKPLKDHSQIEDKIHPDQGFFIAAVREAFHMHAPSVLRYRIDVPLKFTDDQYHLVCLEYCIKGKMQEDKFVIKKIKIIGATQKEIYQGQALNPFVSSEITVIPEQTMPLAIRRTACDLLHQGFKRNGGINNRTDKEDAFMEEKDENRFFPFSPSLMKLMKYLYEYPNKNAGEIAQEMGLEKYSIYTYNRNLLEYARKYLPKNEEFYVNGDKKPKAKVVALYWWNQGFCFDRA